MTEALTPVEIFCSYAHEDEKWRKKLETHLSLLRRQGLVSFWHDRLITPGTDWTKAIDTHLETASIILLLVSADFFASDYCYGIEMKRALELHEAGKAQVIPILARWVDWRNAPFAYLQALPTNARPLSTWKNKDAAFANVVAGIRRVLETHPFLAASASRAVLPTIWNIPYPRNPFFLGRESEIAQMRQQLQASQAAALSQPQAISGLGGIGKTQLALEYAYRYHQDYRAVLWARAESTESLVSSYVIIASLLRLTEQDAKEQEVIVQAVKTWLQTRHDWLLILDNADELALLPDFLPPTLGGHLLLTTRAAATGQLAHRLEIETLLPEHGALFLLRRAGLIASDATLEQASLEERNLALKISQELDGLPLALDQAGAYLEETRTDIGSYWNIYQQHRADLLRQRRGLAADHPAPVATTWSLSFQRVEDRNPAAAELLRLCAYLSPDAIAEEILTAGASQLGSVLAPVAADPFLLNQAIEVLRAYSLVQRDPKEKKLSVHRLVQAVLLDTLEETQRYMWAKRVLHAVNATFPEVEHSTWPKCERVLPQAVIVAQLVELYQIVNGEAGRLLYETASYLLNRARHTQAEPLFQQALYIWEQHLGPDHPDVASPLIGLATLYRVQGRYAQAEPLYQRALHIREQQLGPDHLQVVALLNELAVLYREQGRYAQAEQLFQRVLYIREQQLGPNHLQVASPLTGLANLYREQGRYAQAEPLFQRALHIREQHLGLDHPDVAYTLNGLAILYRVQGRYAQAEPLFQRVLHIREQHLGPDHPRMASPLNNLASLYREQGKYAQAEPIYQRVLHIWEQQVGIDHQWMATPLTGLADLYREQGKYAQAEPLYQRALHIREQQLGPDHSRMATSLVGLANLYREQGKYARAELFYLQALHIQEHQLGLQHLETAETMYGLAQLRGVQGNSEDASVWYTRTLVIREQVLGAPHPKTTETRKRFIALLHTTGQHEEATQLEALRP